MRFRARTDISNADTAFDLLDVDLRNSPSGGLTLRVFDYGQFADAPMIDFEPPVPVGRWFHLEALFQNAPGAAKHLALWLDGRLVVDAPNTTGVSGWVGWSVGDMGLDLGPTNVTVFVDDCASAAYASARTATSPGDRGPRQPSLHVKEVHWKQPRDAETGGQQGMWGPSSRCCWSLAGKTVETSPRWRWANRLDSRYYVPISQCTARVPHTSRCCLRILGLQREAILRARADSRILIRQHGPKEFARFYGGVGGSGDHADPAMFAAEFERFWGQSIDSAWGGGNDRRRPAQLPGRTECPCGNAGSRLDD